MSYLFDSAYIADARTRGYMGLRMSQEIRIVEAMCLDDYESFSNPAPYPWVVAEEAATYVCTDSAEYEADKYWASPEGKRRRGIIQPGGDYDGDLIHSAAVPQATSPRTLSGDYDGDLIHSAAVPQATSPRTPSRKWFFARLQESRDQKTIVLNTLRTVGSLEALYKLCDSIQAFDKNTPIWMNNGVCETLGLRPMGSLYTHVARAFDQAEARVRDA